MNRLRIVFKTSDADDHAHEHLRTDADVEVFHGKVIEFRPRNRAVQGGVIFYQGGRCDPRAYAPVLRPLAAAGFHVFVPQMTLRLAVTGANKAAAVMATHPHIRRWFIGGHSMGGSMAAGFASRHRDELAGLFLLGSYAAGMHAMPDSALPVLLIHGSRDIEVRPAEMAAQSERLPAHTEFVTIEGGDHYQFGSFAGEAVQASISRDEQQRRTVDALLHFLSAAL